MICMCILFVIIFQRMARNGRMTYILSQKASLITCVLLLATVQGFRAYSVGTDTKSYVEMFLYPDKYGHEIGFKLLCDAIRWISDSPSMFLFTCALIINGGVAIACYKMSEIPCLSMLLWVFLYYYFASFNAIRQYLAIALLLNGYCYARSKKWLKYLFCLIMAVSFHQSAIIGIVFALIPIIDNGKRAHALVVTAIILMTSCIPILWESIESFVIRYFPKYGTYFAQQADYVTSGGGIRQSIINVAICASFLFLVDNRSESRCKYDAILLLSVLLSFLQMWILMFDRFLWYFEVFSIMAIPEVAKQSNSKIDSQSKMVYLVFVVLAACLFMLYYLYSGAHRVTPYSWAY